MEFRRKLFGSNTGTANGTFDDANKTTASATAQATVTGRDCKITITKTAGTANVCNNAGTQVTYTYVVTNGANSFFNVSGTVSDDVLGSVGSFGPLAPGASSPPLTKVGTVNGTVTNTGTANGTFDDANKTTASATAQATVTGQDCASSKITPTQTTCTTFSNGTSDTLSTVNYSVRNGKITSAVNPGVFFYWVKVTAVPGMNT